MITKLRANSRTYAAAGAMVALGAAARLVWAQGPAEGMIAGTISIDRGAVSAFRVKAKDTERRVTYTVYTSKGQYRIYNLPSGHYEVTVMEEGITSPTRAVDVPAGATATANLAVKATAEAQMRVGVSGARPQENYGGITPDGKATARLVHFDTLYPPGPGRDLILMYCLGCHGPAGFHQRGKFTEAQWAGRIERMFLKNSGILTSEPMIAPGLVSAQEKQTIIKYLAANFGPASESRDLLPDVLQRDEDELARTVFVQYELPPVGEEAARFGPRPRRATHDLFPSLAAPGIVWVAGLGTNSILKVDIRNPDPATRTKEYFIDDPRKINLGTHGLVERDGHVYWTELNGDHLGDLEIATGKITRYPQPTQGGGHTPRVDRDGNVWFTEVSGAGKIAKWDRATKTITESDPVRNANYYGVVSDKKGRVFVAGMMKQTLVMWDPKSREWSNLKPPASVRRLALDSKDHVWACAYMGNSVIRVDANTLQMEEFKLPLKYGNPYAVYVDKQDNVWLENAVYNAFVKLDPKTKKFSYFPFPDLAAHTPNMEMDPEGTVWFGIGTPSQLTGLKLAGNVPRTRR